jgi:hypothetical protein
MRKQFRSFAEKMKKVLDKDVSRHRPKSSEEAKALIAFIYQHFNQTGQWIGTQRLRNAFGGDKIDKLPNKYDPLLFKRFENDQPDHYELTGWGIFESPGSDEDKKLVCRFFDALKQSYLEDPDQRTIDFILVKEKLGLSQDQLDRLKMLLSMVMHGYSKSIPHTQTTFEIPRDLELLVNKLSIEEYVDLLIYRRWRWDKSYKQRAWAKLDKLHLGFWVMCSAEVWTLSIPALPKFPTISLYVLMGCFWVTLFATAKVLQICHVEHPLVSPKKFIEKLIWWAIPLAISLPAGYMTNFLMVK